MTANREKQTETGLAQAFAIEAARRWLSTEGGSSRNASAIEVLLDATHAALSRGDAPPWKESTDLASAARLIAQAPPSADTRIRGRDLERWWAARLARIEAICREEACEWLPQLITEEGGGRGNPTRFRIGFEPIPSNTDGLESARDREGALSDVIAYRIDPATPALWLRLIIGSKPFAVRSPRGYALLLTLTLDWLLIGGMWYLIWDTWRGPRALMASDLAIVILAGLVTWGLLALSRPLRQLVRQRVSVANDGMLAFNTYYAQLRMQHDGRSRLGSRTFSFVRHWGTCPICAAEVDLAEGGKAFPDRVVGRCHDAPLEHVFSFDPVTMRGRHLYNATSGSRT